MKSEPQNRRISSIQPQRVGGCAIWVLSVALVLFLGAIVWASCDHSITQTTFADYNGTIHTSTGNYYRGEIRTFDQTVGICTVTAYIAHQAGGYPSARSYTLKLWSVDGNSSLTTLLGTAENVYQGGNWTLVGDDNWTRTRKTFRFYNPVRVPAGRVAITINDGNNTAHPINYHAWVRGPSETGVESCAWTSLGNGVDPVAAIEGQFGDYNVATDTDNTILVWTSTGNAVWTKETSGSHDGVDVARSGAIANSQSSSISTTVTGPGDLTFWWNVSSELNYDYFSFYIDAALQTGRISGPSHAWEQKSYTLTAGPHTLTWTYAKDGASIGGTDQAWLDQVTFSNLTPPTPYVPPTDNCTTEYSQMMEITYVETPFLTANWSYVGWPYLHIPEWSAYDADWCSMLDDNITVACELPDAIKAKPGNYKVKARFCHSDNNATRCSSWAHLPYKITDQGGGQTAITNHSHGDTSATITGTHQ